VEDEFISERAKALDQSLYIGGNLAFVVGVGVAFISALLDSDFFAQQRVEGLLPVGSRLFLLIGLTVAFIIIGTAGFQAAFDKPPVFGALYAVVQLALALLIMWVGRGDGLLEIIVIPLVSQCVFLVRNRLTVIMVAIGAMAVIGISHALGGTAPRDALVNVLINGSLVLFVLVFSYALLREQTLRGEIARLNDELRAYADQSAELATAQERNRIAREIHDSLGHHLTTVAVQLEVIQHLIERDPPRAIELAAKARSLTRQGLQDVRDAVTAWRTNTVHRPLPETLRELADTARQTGIPVSVEISGKFDDLPLQAQRTLYRAAQEAITNVRKHAGQVEQVIIELICGEVIRLSIRDNGSGQANGEMPSGGYGLDGLRERIEMLGGQLEAAPHPDGGFQLVVEIPNHA